MMALEMDWSRKETSECRENPLGFLKILKVKKQDISGYSNLKVNKFCLAATGASLDYLMDDNKYFCCSVQVSPPP